jgi:uncharacterized protein YajQ (UPF0234 family)
MPSFGVVCELDLQEVDNAVNQADKEISTRYDFRGGNSSIKFDREKKIVIIIGDDDMKLRAIHEILESKLMRRNVDCRGLTYGKEVVMSGDMIKQEVTLMSGLSKEDAKKVTKLIKESKLKVQAQIQDDQVRVTAKKIDDLQSVMTSLKSSEIGLPLQYVNMRS